MIDRLQHLGSATGGLRSARVTERERERERDDRFERFSHCYRAKYNSVCASCIAAGMDGSALTVPIQGALFENKLP